MKSFTGIFSIWLVLVSDVCGFLAQESSSWTSTSIPQPIQISRWITVPGIKAGSYWSTDTRLYQQNSHGWSAVDDWGALSQAASDPWKQTTSFKFTQHDNDITNRYLDESTDMIDSIYTAPEEVENEDSTFVDDSFEEEMNNEINLLIRCNQIPSQQDDLNKQQTKDVLIHPKNGVITEWFKQCLQDMFQRHSVKKEGSTARIMNARGLASWMTRALADERPVGPHDPRVYFLICKYGTSRSTTDSAPEADDKEEHMPGMTFEGFQQLYTDTLKDDSRVQDVWRDLNNHGYSLTQHIPGVDSNLETLYDECSLVEDAPVQWVEKNGEWERTGKSSHMLVEMTPNQKDVPLHLKDGDFVFVDEESCIGCMQCVLAAPSSFQMLEDGGRARCFSQRNAADVAPAIDACPVNCIHRVGFDRLRELEQIRDSSFDDPDFQKEGHRHFGVVDERNGKWTTHTPLSVAGMDTDGNHKSSVYHYTVHKCYKSGNCPQRGCFDCPLFPPESNRYLQARQEQQVQQRAQYYKSSGIANRFRKLEEL